MCFAFSQCCLLWCLNQRSSAGSTKTFSASSMSTETAFYLKLYPKHSQLTFLMRHSYSWWNTHVSKYKERIFSIPDRKSMSPGVYSSPSPSSDYCYTVEVLYKEVRRWMNGCQWRKYGFKSKTEEKKIKYILAILTATRNQGMFVTGRNIYVTFNLSSSESVKT